MATSPKVSVTSAGEPDASASSLPEEIVEASALGSLMSIGQQPAMLSNLADSNAVVNNNLAMQNAVSNQQAINEVGVAVTGKSVARLLDLGPLESVSVTQVLTGNTAAEEAADLQAAATTRIPRPVTGTVYANAPVYFIFLNEDPSDLDVNTSIVET